MRAETCEVIVKAMIEMSEKYGKEYFEHTNLDEELEALGFTKHVTMSIRGKDLEEKNSNIVYMKNSADFVIIMVSTPYKHIKKPILLDKDVYERYLTKSNIFFVTSKKDRPCVRIDGHIYKLHKVALDFPDAMIDVDHINHCHNSCLRSDLRLATRVQNNENKAYRSHIKGLQFTTRVVIDTNDKANTFGKYIRKGFSFKSIDADIDTVIMISPIYSTKNEMYSAINALEKAFFGEFAYNPINDYEHPVSTELYVRYKLGLISEDEFKALQIEVIKQTKGSRAIEYYQIAC